MSLLKYLSAILLFVHSTSAWNYGGGGGGWHDKIPSKIIVKHVPKHVPVYKPIPIPKPVLVPKSVGYLKPLAIAKPFRVPHVVPVIKHFQKPFPVVKGIPFHFPIPLPKLVKLPFQIKLPKPYLIRVPKPYAVPKKFPVAVPVHIPKPYIVPVLKPVPVGVPYKVPKIIPVVKEVPEYVKKPVPVYIEEKPYKPNYKGTPYLPSADGSYKGTPFPSGIGGHKGSPFPSGVGEHKGTPFPAGGNKGTPYIPSGKGSGGYHSKGTNVHATSAASFLEAHAGKLTESQSGGGFGNIAASYTPNQGHSVYQGLGGGIHGGFQNHQVLNSGYQNNGGNFHESYGSYGGHGIGGYDLHGLASIGGYDTTGLYGRGVDVNKVHDTGNALAEPADYDSGNAVDGHDGGSDVDESYGKNINDDQSNQHQKEGGNQNAGYSSPAYIGISVTSYDDHSGRGGGYPENSENTKYDTQPGYNNQAGGNRDQIVGHAYQGYDSSNSEYHSQDNMENHAHQVNSPNYAQIPQLDLYQIQNGAATAIHYPNAGVQFYNAGYQAQNGYQNQDDNSYANNHVGSDNFGSQTYHQHENSEEGNAETYQHQQHPYAYNANANYQGESYENNQAYGNQKQENRKYGNGNQETSYENQNQETSYENQNQEASYGAQNQEGSYGAQNQEGSYGSQNKETPYGSQNQESYINQGEGYQNQEYYSNQGNAEGYQNQASYLLNQNTAGYQSETDYSNHEVAPGLQNYGLRAAYAVQPGAENHKQLQGTSGTVYMRAYDNQGDNQASYGVHNQESYQTQDSHQQKSYAAYAAQSSVSVSPKRQSDAQKQQTPATGRSFDSSASHQNVGSSSSYSQPEGEDSKGGSWQAVR